MQHKAYRQFPQQSEAPFCMVSAVSMCSQLSVMFLEQVTPQRRKVGLFSPLVAPREKAVGMARLRAQGRGLQLRVSHGWP